MKIIVKSRPDKRQNVLLPEHIDKIVATYQYRTEAERYARRVGMDQIEKNEYNLNISRYVSTAEAEPEIDLTAVHVRLAEIDKRVAEAAAKHNGYFRALGLKEV